MNVIKMLSGATDTLVDLALGLTRGEGKLNRLDYGILEVALMVAALDGEILRAESDSFVRLVRACPGCTETEFAAVLECALRRAGYIAAMAQAGQHSEEQRIDAFVEEASRAMPHGFVDGLRTDVRRAFVTWITMAMSDGDYSGIERRAIAALVAHFSDLKSTRATAAALAWASAYPQRALPAAPVGVSPVPPDRLKLVEDDFFEKAEALVRDLGDDVRAAEARQALQTLVNA